MLWEVNTAKISSEKVEVRFAKIGGAFFLEVHFFREVFFKIGGAIFF